MRIVRLAMARKPIEMTKITDITISALCRPMADDWAQAVVSASVAPCGARPPGQAAEKEPSISGNRRTAIVSLITPVSRGPTVLPTTVAPTMKMAAPVARMFEGTMFWMAA